MLATPTEQFSNNNIVIISRNYYITKQEVVKMYFRICPNPNCGAHLDPGERCDCLEKEKAERIEYEKNIKVEQDGQIASAWEVA